MGDIYFIQSQARRIRNCTYPDELPHGAVCSEYLGNLDERSFWKAARELREIFKGYYLRAENEPEALNLPLVDIEKYRSGSNEARNGYHALLDYPATLLSW